MNLFELAKTAFNVFFVASWVSVVGGFFLGHATLGLVLWAEFVVLGVFCMIAMILISEKRPLVPQKLRVVKNKVHEHKHK